MPEAQRAVQLKNLLGHRLPTGSYRFFFQPETRSYPSSRIMRRMAGISSGESCRSASIVKTTSPSAAAKPQ